LATCIKGLPTHSCFLEARGASSVFEKMTSQEVALMPVPSPDPGGVVLMTLLATIILTPILSLLVLWRYRRAVTRSMHVTAPGGRQADVAHQWRPPLPTQWAQGDGYSNPVLTGSSAPVVTVPVGSTARTAAVGGAWPLARRRTRLLCCVYVAAGVAYGLVAAIVWLQAGNFEAGNFEVVLLRVGVLTAVYSWLTVPTVLQILAPGSRTTALVWAGYLLLLLLLSVVSGIGRSMFNLVGLMVVLPAVVVLALSAGSFRAVGPFLAVPVFIAGAGLSVWPWLALPLVSLGFTAVVSYIIVIPVVLVISLTGLGYLWLIARQYARKRASDQMLLVSQWWFFATLWGSILLLPLGVGWALAFFPTYVAFRLVVAIGLRLRKRPDDGPPLRLLLLRVFGSQRRSERLLHRLGASWRQLGPVQMIAGTDLATAALGPDEFLDSLRGRLNRQFIGNADELDRRLAQLDLRPDPDGRYRVNELFCHDDSWRPAVQRLVHSSDGILLDLRGFTAARQGATYEITQLVELVPLRQVLVLTDDTTDHNFLRTVLDTAWQGMGPESPNWTDGGALRLLQMAPRDGVDAEAVIALLSPSR
jgi:hypothetical protein